MKPVQRGQFVQGRHFESGTGCVTAAKARAVCASGFGCSVQVAVSSLDERAWSVEPVIEVPFWGIGIVKAQQRLERDLADPVCREAGQ